MTPKIYSYSQALIAAGLTKEQANVYEPLIREGKLRATQLAKRAELSRTYVYRILEELEGLGLITREEPPGKPAVFAPRHPFALEELARKRQEEANIAKRTLEGAMASLISDYTAASKIPGVRVLSGIEGLEEIYKDILKEKKDILLIRSALDNQEGGLKEMVLAQIAKQVAAGIRTRLIGRSRAPGGISEADLRARDKARLTERRTLPRDSFQLPAQIIIYGNKVAITSYREPLITTVIENDAIRETMQVLFELLWNTGEKPSVGL
jgi:sugar-specific transcriptional regulator TrmB